MERKHSFDVDTHARAVDQLVKHDETELALRLCDMVPAYFRHRPHPKLTQLKSNILAAMMTPYAYSQNKKDMGVGFKEGAHVLANTVRGQFLHKLVDEYNTAGRKPHIVDLGPGDFWIPTSLTGIQAAFTYQPIGLQNDAQSKAITCAPGAFQYSKLDPSQPTIFVAAEIIEHLHNPQDIVTDCLRVCGGWPEQVILSTPCFNFDYNENWNQKDGIQHLRAYTPNEFTQTLTALFPFHSFQLAVETILTAIGVRTDILEKSKKES